MAKRSADLTEDWVSCPGCGKRSYRTRRTARRVIRKNYPGEGGMRAYPCRMHGGLGFHIGHGPNLGRNLNDPRVRVLPGEEH